MDLGYNTSVIIEKALIQAETRIPFLLKNETSVLVEGYKNGEHLMTVACDGHPRNRALFFKIIGALGADMMIVNTDMYLTQESQTTLEQVQSSYVRGSLAERFARNDPNVTEGMSVSVCCMDDDGEFMHDGAALPYVRSKGKVFIKERVGDSSVDFSNGAIMEEIRDAILLGVQANGAIPPLLRLLIEGIVNQGQSKFIAIREDLIEDLEGNSNGWKKMHNSLVLSNEKLSEVSTFSTLTDILR